MGMKHSATGLQGGDGRPGMMQSRLSQPPLTPPACRSMSSFKLILSSSSTVQGRLTWPLMQKSLVPWLFLRPNCVNHSGPRRRIVGETATVSTFVTVEGHPYRPTFAGNGGLSLGLPCLPSRDSISAVSSPSCTTLCENLHIQNLPSNSKLLTLSKDACAGQLSADCRSRLQPGLLKVVITALTKQEHKRPSLSMFDKCLCFLLCSAAFAHMAGSCRRQMVCHLVIAQVAMKMLTTDICASSIGDHDIKVYAAATGILADEAFVVCLLDGSLQGKPFSDILPSAGHLFSIPLHTDKPTHVCSRLTYKVAT